MEQHDINKIDNYLLGRLSTEERNAFEQEMENDATLKQAVQTQQLVLQAVDTIGDLRMRKRINRIHEASKPKGAKVRTLNSRSWAIAAIGLVALALCLWMWLRPPLNERLYADFFEPHPITFSNRDLNTEVERSLIEASRFYKNNDLKSAAPIFEKYVDINTADDKLLLAAGISFMEINNDKALDYFNIILQHAESSYLDHARWYAALVYLNKNETENSKRQLEQLTENKNGFFYQKAESLLSEIN
ncbi:MAG: hypothetical protein AAFZ15_09515 [Bacteroidota bacterium]